MKEIQDLQPDRTEVHAQREVEKKLAYHGSFRLHRGQKVFECDVRTQEIREAEYEVGAALFTSAAKDGIANVRHRLIMREGCLYAPAINLATARKKFVKMLFAHYEHQTKG